MMKEGVAPLVGAWIETRHHDIGILKRLSSLVAPLVGAWIETHNNLYETPLSRRGLSRSLWARGLKQRHVVQKYR